jgi:hypothetical protein
MQYIAIYCNILQEWHGLPIIIENCWQVAININSIYCNYCNSKLFFPRSGGVVASQGALAVHRSNPKSKNWDVGFILRGAKNDKSVGRLRKSCRFAPFKKKGDIF